MLVCIYVCSYVAMYLCICMYSIFESIYLCTIKLQVSVEYFSINLQCKPGHMMSRSRTLISAPQRWTASHSPAYNWLMFSALFDIKAQYTCKTLQVWILPLNSLRSDCGQQALEAFATFLLFSFD